MVPEELSAVGGNGSATATPVEFAGRQVSCDVTSSQKSGEVKRPLMLMNPSPTVTPPGW